MGTSSTVVKTCAKVTGFSGYESHVLGGRGGQLAQTFEDAQTPTFQLDRGNMVAGSSTTTWLISFSG